MNNISVVIITKNEAHVIGNTLQSLEGLTDDIVIVDSGSSDDTIRICQQYKTRIIETGWAGYGMNKNMGIDAAYHDWILSLDADEAIDDELKQALRDLEPANDSIVFNIRFKNFFCNKWIRYGEWGSDTHIRLFNRKRIRWNADAVHESLILPVDTIKINLKGNILHYTVSSGQEYEHKIDSYARLNAQKYYEEGKRAGFFKMYCAPLFAFIQFFIFRLGFLDGKEGLVIAKATMHYTYLKYHYLNNLNRAG